MIQEVLVLLACISNKGCTPTVSLYYDSNPKIEQTVKTNERIVLKQLAPEVITVAPYALFFATGRGSFRLVKNTVLTVGRNNVLITIYKTF